MTSAEDGGAETTQYLILQGPDDGMFTCVKYSTQMVQQCISREDLNQGCSHFFRMQATYDMTKSK